MSVTPAQVVAQARTYLGAPFVHQGRTPRGMDCSGLVVLTARALGLSQFDVAGYARTPHGNTLEKALRDGGCIPSSMSIGSLLLLRFEREPQHLAIVTDYALGGFAMIHGYSVARGVVEHRIDAKWQRRIVSSWDMPGVEYGA